MKLFDTILKFRAWKTLYDRTTRIIFEADRVKSIEEVERDGKKWLVITITNFKELPKKELYCDNERVEI